MLKNVDPLLHADILHALASMGHGDSLTICDRNFPATSVGADTAYGDVLQMSVDTPTALKAILSVLPIDTYDLDISASVQGMQIVGDPDGTPEVIALCAPLIAKQGTKISLVDRHAFYDICRESFVVIRTIESRPYGNLVIRKGVITD